MLITFPDGIKLGGVLNALEDRIRTQGCLWRRENRAETNMDSFSETVTFQCALGGSQWTTSVSLGGGCLHELKLLWQEGPFPDMLEEEEEKHTHTHTYTQTATCLARTSLPHLPEGGQEGAGAKRLALPMACPVLRPPHALRWEGHEPPRG